MSSHERFSDNVDPTPEQEAWNSLRKTIAALSEAAESMGENRPLYDDLLRRIAARLEIFRFENTRDSLGNGEDDGHLFVPANQRREGLLATESESYNHHGLYWRRLLDTDGTTIFWECHLVDSDRWGGVVTVLYESALPSEQVTPELVDKYLGYTLEYPLDALSSLSPVKMALVDDDSGFELTEYYKEDQADTLVLPLEIINKLFYLAE